MKLTHIAASILIATAGASASAGPTWVIDSNTADDVTIDLGSASVGSLSNILVQFDIFVSGTKFGDVVNPSVTMSPATSVVPTQSAGGSGNLFDDADFAAGTFSHYSASFNSIGPGAYFFSLGGDDAGKKIAMTNFSATITPVPEPETYAMMLAGLGALGFMARRRRAK